MRISPELKKLIEKYRCVKDTEGMSPAKDVYKRQDEYGNQSMVVDEVLRGRMETRLITKILSFEIK